MDPEERRCDPAAVKVFLDHEAFIRTVVSLHVHNKDEADDAIQDLFISFVGHPLNGDIRDIKSYLYRVTTNHVIDALHREEKYRVCLHEYAEGAYRPARQKTPEESVMEMQELNAVLALIENRLPRAEALAVYLRYREGLNTKEIAEKLGVRITTVRGFVSEGLAGIRTLLRDIALEARARLPAQYGSQRCSPVLIRDSCH